MQPASASFFAPTDSARTVADVYNVSLVATLLVLAGGVAFLWLRDANAGTRAIVWRCTLLGVLGVYAGRFVPWQWMAWVLPQPLARPLVSLGTITLERPPGLMATGAALLASSTLSGLIALYWIVLALIIVRTVAGRWRLARIGRWATTLDGPHWRVQLQDAGDAIGVSTSGVRLAYSRNISVPLTWGVSRPIVLLPDAARHWPVDRLQAVLRHELVHVRARDAAMRLAARVACALFWFHPGVWWMARRFEADAEEAADDRVLLSGIRLSDYAEWLGASAPHVDAGLEPAMALVRRGTLRARLAAVTNTQRVRSAPGRRVAVFAASVTVVFVAPLATARLAPTRGVLTSLVTETRWESRAWAVVHLARRADSVDVARSVARDDPDPAVRAWARYALGLNPAAGGPDPRRGS